MRRIVLAMVIESIETGMPEDFFTIDLKDAYTSLGFIIGKRSGMIWQMKYLENSVWENRMRMMEAESVETGAFMIDKIG